MHFVSVLISGIRNWLIHLRSRIRDSREKCCSPVFLDIAQWITDKCQKRQRKIFGWDKNPSRSFSFFVILVLNSIYQSMLSEQTIAESMAVWIPKNKHLTFTFPSRAASQYCLCTSPKNEIDTGHLFLAIPNFFQSGSLKISVWLYRIRSRTIHHGGKKAISNILIMTW